MPGRGHTGLRGRRCQAEAHRPLCSGSRPGGISSQAQELTHGQNQQVALKSGPLLHGTDEETKAHAGGAQSTPWLICLLLLRVPEALLSWLVPSPWAEEPHTSRAAHQPHLLPGKLFTRWRGCKHGSLLGPLTCLLGVGSSPPIATAQRLAGFTLPPQASCSNWASPMEEEAVPVNVTPATGFLSAPALSF